jgi:hypothetical protein
VSVTAETEKFLAGYEAGPLAAVAMELARRLDDPDEGSAAQIAKELRATLAAVRDSPAKEVDPVDALTARRAARRSKAAG